MFDFLKPNFYYHSVHDIEDDFFCVNGIQCVLFDIDNTLEPYATEVPSQKTVELFEKLKKEGIAVAIISNNHEPRVKAFCEPLGVTYTFDSGKPSSKNVKSLLEKLNVSKQEVALIGDQLFTDIWCANNSKIKGIFVDRINNKESFFIKLKRVIEIPFVASIKKKGYGKIK